MKTTPSSAHAPSWDGAPERRRHKVYVTRNTEYHVRDGVCVAVRDRGSKRFRDAHIALNLPMEGGVRVYSNGAVLPSMGEPRVGDAIYFARKLTSSEDHQIVTSRLESIGRPPKRDVLMYPLANAALRKK